MRKILIISILIISIRSVLAQDSISIRNINLIDPDLKYLYVFSRNELDLNYYTNDSMSIYSDDIEIVYSHNKYSVYPKPKVKTPQYVDIQVYKRLGKGDSVLVKVDTFEIKDFGVGYVASLGNLKYQEAYVDNILLQDSLLVDIPNCFYKVNFIIDSYDLIIVKSDSAKVYHNTGPIFSDRYKKEIIGMTLGDKLIFYDIKGFSNTGSMICLRPIIYDILE